MRRLGRERDIALSVHGSWQASPVEPGGFARLEADARFAIEIGASVFVVHLYSNGGIERYATALAPLVNRLAGARIRVAIENTPDTPPSHFNELFAAGRRQQWKGRVVMCLDVGHANLCADTRNDYLAYLDRLEPAVPIAHVHLHENWGDGDSHLMVFTGPAARDSSGVEALIGRLARRGFGGRIILEQWPDPPALLDAARDRLLAILERSAHDQ